MIGLPPDCLRCKHFNENYERPMGTPSRCEAFPEGIPEAIYSRGEPHTKPWPGDHGIQFEPREEPTILPVVS